MGSCSSCCLLVCLSWCLLLPVLVAIAPGSVLGHLQSLRWGDLVALCPASAAPVPATATFCIQRHTESSVPSPAEAVQEKDATEKVVLGVKSYPRSTRFWASLCLAWPGMGPSSQLRLAARAQPLLGFLQREVGHPWGNGTGRMLSPRDAAVCCTLGTARLRSRSPSRAISCTALWDKPPLHRGWGRSLPLLTPPALAGGW